MNILDKFSFLGMRKDYWNFFAECLPKDEGVRYVNSLSQVECLHTPCAAQYLVCWNARSVLYGY